MRKFQGRRKKTIKSIIVPIIVISLIFSGFSAGVDHADATALLAYGSTFGATFHNGTNIQVPEVDVYIIYTQVTGELDISYEFTIITNTTQNMTLVIAFPTWKSNTANISVALNMSQINCRALTWAELGWNSTDYEDFRFAEYWFYDALYAFLDLSLIQNTASIIEFSIKDEARNVDYFELKYFVDSIKTLDSNSHQRIHIEIIDEDGLLASESFVPNDFRTTNSYNDTTEAFWEFYVSEITFDIVVITLIFDIYHPPDNIIQYLLTNFGLAIIGVLGAAGVIALVLYRRRQ